MIFSKIKNYIKKKQEEERGQVLLGLASNAGALSIKGRAHVQACKRKLRLSLIF